jgi:hypothetical protein
MKMRDVMLAMWLREPRVLRKIPAIVSKLPMTDSIHKHISFRPLDKCGETCYASKREGPIREEKEQSKWLVASQQKNSMVIVNTKAINIQ